MKQNISTKKAVLFAAGALTAAALTAAVAADNYRLTDTAFEVYSDKLPQGFDGYKIVQLSDLHGREYGKANAKLVERVRAVRPDIVVMTGDLLDDNSKTDDVLLALSSELLRDFAVYYIVGNHELRFEEARRMGLLAKLRDCGVRVLDNETISLTRGGDEIALAGLWYDLKYYTHSYERDVRRHPQNYVFGTREMEALLGTIDPQRFTLLLAHNPLHFETYAAWGADLTFAGHMHGGMVRLPALGGLLSPDVRFFPPYTAGIVELDGCKMIVSRGLGNGKLIPRVLNCPEIVTVTLRTK